MTPNRNKNGTVKVNNLIGSQNNLNYDDMNYDDKMEDQIDDQVQMNINIEQMKCHYHQTKTITNFCDEQNCILPMCPECVQIHSDYHKSNNTRLNFKSIENIMNTIYDQFTEHQQIINQNDKSIREFETIINSNSDLLRNQLLQLKQQAMLSIEEYFDNLSQKMEQMLNQQIEEHQQQIEYMDQQNQNHQQSINSLIEGLQEDPLSSIVKIKSEHTFDYLYTQTPKIESMIQQIKQNFIQIFPNNNKISSNIDDVLSKNVFIKQNNILMNNNDNVQNILVNNLNLKQSMYQNNNYQPVKRSCTPSVMNSVMNYQIQQNILDRSQISPSKITVYKPITPSKITITKTISPSKITITKPILQSKVIYTSQASTLPVQTVKTVRFNPHRQIVNNGGIKNSYINNGGIKNSYINSGGGNTRIIQSRIIGQSSTIRSSSNPRVYGSVRY